MNTHAAPTLPLSADAADQGRVAVSGQRHAEAELTAGSGLAAGGELWALLGPGRARAREHPRRPDVAVVDRRRRSGPCCRQRTAPRCCRSRRSPVSSLAGELGALLGPGRPRAREHPRRPRPKLFVGRVRVAADQGRVAVSGQRHAGAELQPAPVSSRGGELWALLGPGRARAREHPRRPDDAGSWRRGCPWSRRSGPCCRRPTAPRWSRTRRQIGGPRASVAVSFGPCWVQVEPERVNTHAAPTLPLSHEPPIRAVLPSADSATVEPNAGRIPGLVAGR